MIARCIGTLDIAKLALKTEVDDLADVFAFNLFRINFGLLALRAVVIDGIEHLWKTAAVFNAHTAIRA